MLKLQICLIGALTIITLLVEVNSKKSKPEEKPTWAKKDIRDFSEADMERLLDQWEVSFMKCLLSKSNLS